MASEVSTAGAKQDLGRRVMELERELAEAHQREAATAELLQVINRPQFALQSVFDVLCGSVRQSLPSSSDLMESLSAPPHRMA